MKMRKRSEAKAEERPSQSALASRQHHDAPKNGVEAISSQLRDELRKENEKPPGGYKFPVAQRSTGEAKLRPDLRQIVETHWVEDMNASWIRIRGMLKVGEKRSNHGHLHRALDDARDLAYEAHGLAVTAKLERHRWEAANELTHAAMWSEATRAIQHEKDTGQRSKQITDTDVRARAALIFPDEWSAQEHDREKVKLTVERMERLAKDASEKCEDLRVMLSKLRG